MSPSTTGDDSTPDDTRSGRVLLGRFRVERILGRGGMGEVLLARDQLLGRLVALKRLSGGGTDEERRRALLREARRIGQINDPRIASIYDVLEVDDDVLLVMEYVEGVTLRQRMAEPLPLDAFWGLALPCVDALAAAHAHGVIHRDIKPENLMVTPEGRIKILDFGIARRAESHSGDTTTRADTRAATMAGTPQYMAPEAFIGVGVDERTDLFAMGVVFYELLTGARPFEGDSFAGVLERMLRSTPPAARDRNPAVGPALSSVVSQLLSRDQADRIESASRLRLRLEQAWREDSTGERPAIVLADAGVEGVDAGDSVPPASLAGAGAAAGNASAATPVGAETPVRRGWQAWLAPAVATLAVAAVVTIAIRWAVPVGTPWGPSLPSDRNLAVLAPTSNDGADPEFAHFAMGAMDWLSGRLARRAGMPGFQIRPLSEAIVDQVTSVADARRVLGSTLALTASFSMGRADLLFANLELWDTVSGLRIAARSVDAPASMPFAFLQRLDQAAASMVGLPETPATADTAFGVYGAGTLRFVLQGSGRLRAAATVDDAAKAVADFELACRVEPEAPAARSGLARAQLVVNTLGGDASVLAGAEAEARQAVALDTTRSESYRVLGYVLARRRDMRAAVEAYDHARRLDPTDLESWHRMARTHVRLGEPERERQIYEQVIRLMPHRWQPRWWLATWHYDRGELDDAIRGYEEMVRRAPQFETGYSNLGGVLLMRGEYERAIETLKQAVALRPTKAAYNNLGTVYFNTRRFDEAIAAYNQSFQFGLADYMSWFNLGDAYYWLRGRKTDAAKAYEESIKLGREEVSTRLRQGRPADPMVSAHLATMFPKVGHADSALFYLSAALRADSANPKVQCCAAMTYWQLGDRPRALAWLERSVAGGYPTVWLRDSPVFRDWRADSSFRSLVGATGPDSPPAASTAGSPGG